MGQFKNDLKGKKFGRLTVIRHIGFKRLNKYPVAIWECECKCGNIIEIDRGKLVSGNTRSCGCLKKDLEKILHRTHGYSKISIEYKAWKRMRQRCLNPNDNKYYRYGARGITICKEWDNFENFLRDVGPKPSNKHSLDRINNDGNYEPGNVRWALPIVQMNNQSTTLRVEYNGETHTITEWAKITGINREVLQDRLLRGWSIERVFEQPVRKSPTKRRQP